MIPKIKSVKPLKHYILHVIFEYGEEIKLCPPETGKYQSGAPLHPLSSSLFLSQMTEISGST